MKNNDLSECIRLFDVLQEKNLGRIDFIEKLNSLKDEDSRAFFDFLKKKYNVWVVAKGFGKKRGKIVDVIIEG